MKSALTVVLFLLFTIGVCVDGYEVSVTEGDSVTLKSGVTERQTDDGIEWRFNKTRIAKISRGDNETWVKPDGSFKDRLQLDRQTGDLKISNISTTDSGEYKVEISRLRNSPPEMTFTVKVVPVDVFADEVESVSGLEGFPVTLHTDLTEIQGDYVIQWRYGPQKSPVAEINRKAGIVNTVDTDERFRDRLKLDHQTGSLTIKNTRTTDSGLYEVYISSSRSRHTRHHTQSFSLTVRDDVKSMSVLEGDNVTLRPDLTGTERIEQIRWTFGDDGKFIADLNGPANQDNFGLNKQTGVLTIRNIQKDQSGDYKVEIKTRTMTSHRKYQITVVALPGPRLSPAAVAGIGVGGGVVGGVGVILLAAAGVFYYRYKKSKDSKDNQMQNQPLKRQLAMDSMNMDSKDNQMQNQPLKRQLADDTENVSLKNLCGSQSAESDTENSPFREIKGNKEHGYDIL